MTHQPSDIPEGLLEISGPDAIYFKLGYAVGALEYLLEGKVIPPVDRALIIRTLKVLQS